MSAADEGRALTSDDAELRRALRARERVYRAAYAAGLDGSPWEPEVWPPGDDVHDAYLSGVDERRARRRDRRRAFGLGALGWAGRHLAPTTARRLRRWRRRWRRARARADALRGAR